MKCEITPIFLLSSNALFVSCIQKGLKKHEIKLFYHHKVSDFYMIEDIEPKVLLIDYESMKDQIEELLNLYNKSRLSTFSKLIVITENPKNITSELLNKSSGALIKPISPVDINIKIEELIDKE